MTDVEPVDEESEEGLMTMGKEIISPVTKRIRENTRRMMRKRSEIQ